MDIKEKRNKVLNFLMAHCDDVLRDMKMINDVDTIAGFDKEDFCEIVDDIIYTIEAAFESNKNYLIDNEKYAVFEIEQEEGGYTTKDYITRNYSYWFKWLIPSLNNINDNDGIAYSKTLYITVDENFSIQIVKMGEVYREEFEEDLLIKRWISNKITDYSFEDFEELQSIFLDTDY